MPAARLAAGLKAAQSIGFLAELVAAALIVAAAFFLIGGALAALFVLALLAAAIGGVLRLWRELSRIGAEADR